MSDTTDDILIERCARIADDTILELKAILASRGVRTSRYDRQTKLQIETAIRYSEKTANTIRELKHSPTKRDPLSDEALDLLRELRPVVASGKKTLWRGKTLMSIDWLLQDDS